MREIKTGGQAFPTVGSQYSHEEGMTLRDYFAAKAMQGYISSDDECEWDPIYLASWAYRVADAMIAERAKGE